MHGMHNPHPATATEALERLGRPSLRELSMETLLQTVADLTTRVLPGNPDTSVTLLVRGRPTTVVSTGQLAVTLDETQYERGHGPCLHAARTGELIEIPDTRTDVSRPEYTRRAAGHGSLSSSSVPLLIDGDQQVTGALNIYARSSHAFDEDSRSAATRFGPYAAVAVGNLHAYQNARDTADHLQLALESRAVIDQAKGVLVERHKLTSDQDFQVLARASMHINREVRDIADHLVHTGELLGSPVRRSRSSLSRGGCSAEESRGTATVIAGPSTATATSPPPPETGRPPVPRVAGAPVASRNPSSFPKGLT